MIEHVVREESPQQVVLIYDGKRITFPSATFIIKPIIEEGKQIRDFMGNLSICVTNPDKIVGFTMELTAATVENGDFAYGMMMDLVTPEDAGA